MGKLEAIEHEVETLTATELAEFRGWFAQFDAANWDRQIAQDVEKGKLDALAQRALSAHQAGKSTPL